MEPEIRQGDDLLIQSNSVTKNGVISSAFNHSNIVSDGIYLVRLNGHLHIKRLLSDYEDKTKIIVKSDNAKYETLYLKVNQLKIEGKVVWFSRKL